MNAPLRIGVAGLGTVGVGVLKLLNEHAALLGQRCGREISVVAVSARDQARDRGIDLGAYRWVNNALDMIADPEIDVIVELIGGEVGVAKSLVEDAIHAGKSVVTANKALIAHHGSDLGRAAEAADVTLAFEAAVAGGIPILKAIRESLAGNRLSRIYGILNGTCNYILTAMQESGREFSDVLAEAQSLGYAEEDPSFDVDGIDAAHKLAILTSLAFGCTVNFDAVYVEGIRTVSPIDIMFAEELGYRIKLLAIARETEHGIEQRVHPCMVPLETPIAHVGGVFNAVVVEGDHIDRAVFEGRGAGAGPTASAVVADLVDIARGLKAPIFAVPAADLIDAKPAAMELHQGPYYVRLQVVDRPGVMADIAAILRDENVSIESLLQRGRSPDEAVPVVLTMHNNQERSMTAALAKIWQLDTVLEEPHLIRIEHL